MENPKKYFWLKLKDDFFNQKEIKKLRKIAGGDTYTIIYLKMQLKSIKNNGILIYEGVEDCFYKEIALDIDEEEEDVKLTIVYLTNHKFLEQISTDEYILTRVNECVGSESKSAERVRKHRLIKENNSNNLLQCNTGVTNCNIDIEIDKELDDRKIDITNNTIYQQLENLKLVQELTNKYDTIFKNKEIYISNIKILPDNLIKQIKLFQKIISELVDTNQTAAVERINFKLLEKVYGQVIIIESIENIVSYFKSSLLNEIVKRRE